MKAPTPYLLLDYEDFFDEKQPSNRISLIKHISRKNILFELTALNYRLKPKDKVHIDSSIETQIRELEYFAQIPELSNYYLQIFKSINNNKKIKPIIFSRQTCLFAIEEIVNSSDIKEIEDFKMGKVEVWDAILKYILAVNTAITYIKEDQNDKDFFLESLNSKLLPLNELAVETDPIYIPYRGFKLIEFFLKNSVLKDEVESYFQENYNMKPNHFIFNLMSMYMANNTIDPGLNFYYRVPEEKKYFFDKLSDHFPNNETHKLISIKKSPFIKVGNLEYLIVDNSFLLDKTYSQFINDFWFDRVKKIKDERGVSKYSIQLYRSIFGYFFEHYVSQILKKSFVNYKYSKLLMFDELKIEISKKPLELADIYLRYNNKIFLAQVKSGSIYDSEKFGGNIESLYKNNRNEFFKNFGINQLIESIKNIDIYMHLLDSKFPKGHIYKVYPCIIVNDKAFQTPLIANIFNIRFQELLKDFDNKKIVIKSLTLIHISELESVENFLNSKPEEIWELLEYNQRDKRYIPPFYNSLQRWNSELFYSDRVKQLLETLIQNCNSNDNEAVNGAM